MVMTLPTPADYSCTPPSVKLSLTPFQVKVDDAVLDELRDLLINAKLPRDTFENNIEDGSFGVSKGWVQGALEYWRDQFDWRRQERRINSFPHFKAQIKDDNRTIYDIHFVALFSLRPDALPVIFLHGWPGSFSEFLGMLDILRSKYTPETPPYHIVVPSLPGYTFSSLPVQERFTPTDAARITHYLAVGLGFTRYVVQGGDIGSRIARIMGATYSACKAVHLNVIVLPKPEEYDISKLTDKEKAGLARGAEFRATGLGYASVHKTRPSTIGIIVSDSPIALLAWIGEKFVAWSDETPSLDLILESLMLYWVTNCFPTSIWNYRETSVLPDANKLNPDPQYIKTYLGFSHFPKEINALPKDWIAAGGNLVHFSEHDKGGHFPTLEIPEELLSDVESFIATIRDRL